jgi:hypothetical protein
MTAAASLPSSMRWDQHRAFWVIFVLAALGALTAAIAFQRRTTQTIEFEPAPSLGPVVPEADGRA